MRTLTILSAALVFCSGAALARPYDEIMKDAQAAFAADNYAAAATLLDEAQAQRPYSIYLTRNRVLTRALTNRMDEAIALAGEVADRGLILELPKHEAIDRLKLEPAFAPVAAKMAANAAPIGDPQLVVEADDNGLLPEAIAPGKSGENIIGSVRTGKILAIGPDGTERVIAIMDGGVFDVEPRKKALYAAVNNPTPYEKAQPADAPYAAIVALDPVTGERRREIVAKEFPTLLGDLEVAKDGTIYASDSITPRIFRGSPGAEAFDVFTADARFTNPQGIALDEKHHRLYVADYLAGLFAVDTKTGEVTQIANPTNAHLGGVDGLYLYKDDLIGIQNGTTPQRIVRITLDKRGAVAESLEVLAQTLAGWNEPTHGFVDGERLIYIATSNWPAYDDEGKVRDGATLAPLRIMSLPLE